MKKIYVGVDIGGTSIKLAFVNDMAEILMKWEIPTNTKNNGSMIVKDIANAILEKTNEMGENVTNLLGIGVGAPGFLDIKNGIVVHAVNIGWKDYPLQKELENQTGLPVKLDNDANLACAGELWVGSAKGASDILFITLGTGVGGGIIIDGKIVHGILDVAGEIGHITADYFGKYQCNCGKKGCLETVTSATGIVRLAKDRLTMYPESRLNTLQEITAKDVFDAYKEQDTLAIKTINEFANYLGIALANLANTLNPEFIVIGGGVSKAGDILIDVLRSVFEKHAIPRAKEKIKLRLASLGNDAGVIGCAWLIKEALNY